MLVNLLLRVPGISRTLISLEGRGAAEAERERERTARERRERVEAANIVEKRENECEGGANVTESELRGWWVERKRY